MKKILALLLAAVLCLGLVSVAFAAEDPVTTIDTTLELGDAVPNFTVTLEDGSVFTLSEALETYKAVMVNFWYIQCPHCVAEMPVMQKAYANYSDDVAVVCLSYSDDNADITAFKQKNNLDLIPMGADTVGLAKAVGVTGFPTTIMIDRFGNYAYCEIGEISDSVQFTRMWDYFISDDYTESQVVEEIPGPKYEGEFPADEDLSATFCPDGSLTFTYDHEDDTLWPFVVSDNGIINSNALELDTTASLSTTVSAKAGDVFAFDYAADLETMTQTMQILVNGEAVKPICFTYSTTWYYEFPEDGDYQIDFVYEESATSESTEAAGTIELSNARLVAAADADTFYDTLPAFVYSLEGEDSSFTLVNEDAKEIKMFSDDPDAQATFDQEGIEFYIVPSGTATFLTKLGEDLDATQAFVLEASDSFYYTPIVTAEQNDEGYLVDIEICSMEEDGIPGTVVCFTHDMVMFDKNVHIFTSEENVNAYVQEEMPEMGYEGVTWAYADGSLPSTDECATTAEEASFLYNIYIVDENGDPVNDCMINICDASNCCPQMLTSTNYYGFNGIKDAQYAYIIHVLKVPDGYSFDKSTSFTLNAEGDTLTITVPHA